MAVSVITGGCSRSLGLHRLPKWLPVFVSLLSAGQGTAAEVESWSFPLDRTVAPLSRTDAATAKKIKLRGKPTWTDDVPGPHIYDPLLGRSRKNAASLVLDGSQTLETTLPVQSSVTIEAFVKPLNAVDGHYIQKTRLRPAASLLGIKLDHFHAHNQFYFRGLAIGEGQAQWPIAPGYYGSSAQFQGEQDHVWRHLAVVYDRSRGTVSAYVNHYLSKTVPITEPLTFDDGPLVLGAAKLEAHLDELRVTNRALSPGEFLRAVSQPLQGVSFTSSQKIAPADAGCMDVKEHFGAVGDGKTDDTEAFRRAFAELCSRVPLAYHTLLIPPGTYLITDIVLGGRFIDVQGAGPDQTILKLKNGTFTDPQQPRPVIRMSSTHGDPGSNHGVNGSSISVYMQGFTIDTGTNNPGAKGLEYHANNIGRLENVVIRSGDGRGVCGLDLTHHDCGPALVKHVTVEGFDVGVHSRYQEYSMTFEHLQLRGQRVCAVLNEGNILAMRKVQSLNAVPAVICRGANSMLTLMDSTLEGGDQAASAITTDGALYALRVSTSGYGTSITQRSRPEQEGADDIVQTVADSVISEYVSRPIVSRTGRATGALKLPIEETPEAPRRPLSEWVNILQFSSARAGEDDGPMVQAAIDSGAKVLYVPANTGLSFRTPVVLRGQVERIVGFGQEWSWHPSVYERRHQREQTDTTTAPPPVLIFNDDRAERTVWLDRLSIQSLEHASRGTLVLRSSSPDYYRTGVAGGRLFAEDIGGADWHFDHPHQVWVRQWNPESHAAGPCIHSRGATIWALGFKTEYESQKLLAEDRASTEILGAFIYPIGEIPKDRPIFENRNSRLSIVFGSSVYHANHHVQIRDIHGSETLELGNDRMYWAGSRARMDLYVSEE
jgi:hypothetical protein